jgi:hypothetical protein
MPINLIYITISERRCLMTHRSHMSFSERHARSKLAKLLHDNDIICGSLVTMSRTCGKPKCRCLSGSKHKSLYLALRFAGKRKMICIPKKLEPRVRNAVSNYKEYQLLTDEVSSASLERILQRAFTRGKNVR